MFALRSDVENTYRRLISFDVDGIGEKAENVFFGNRSDIFEINDEFVCGTETTTPTEKVLSEIESAGHWSESSSLPHSALIV
jgi:hypothetical protein